VKSGTYLSYTSK